MSCREESQIEVLAECVYVDMQRSAAQGTSSVDSDCMHGTEMG